VTLNAGPAARRADGKGELFSYLKRIPPLDELTNVREKEELTA
jgi:hypothetical protein